MAQFIVTTIKKLNIIFVLDFYDLNYVIDYKFYKNDQVWEATNICISILSWATWTFLIKSF